MASVTQNSLPTCISELTPIPLASGVSPRIWLYQVPDTSFPVPSFGVSSPFSLLSRLRNLSPSSSKFTDSVLGLLHSYLAHPLDFIVIFCSSKVLTWFVCLLHFAETSMFSVVSGTFSTAYWSIFHHLNPLQMIATCVLFR